MNIVKEATFSDPQWDANEYRNQREMLQDMVNGNRKGHSYHPKAPVIDRDVFKKSEEEKFRLKEYKAINKRLPKK